MVELPRQAGDAKTTGVPQIEVTPEMIQAGMSAIQPFVMPDGVLAAFSIRRAIEAVLHAAIRTHRQSYQQVSSTAD